MINRLRASFAAKMLVGGLLLGVIVIGGVSGYLIVSRNSQTVAGALSNSDNRAGVMREVLDQFTGTQSFSTAHGLAAQRPLANALGASDARTAVRALFAGSPPVDLAYEVLLITDVSGQPLFVRAAPDLGGIDVAPFAHTRAVTDALRGVQCRLAMQPGSCGVDVIGGSDPTYAVASPVVSDGRTVGVVAYVAPLTYQLGNFNALFQFPTVFVPLNDTQRLIRLSNGFGATSTTPPGVVGGMTAAQDIVHGTYSAPVDTSGTLGDVAGSYAAVKGTDGQTIVGYVGIEVPLAPFIGDQRTDELTLSGIAIFALLLMVILIIVFVEIVVRRPIHRLDRGVARIAGGDYTTSVNVRSRDELGRLAASVNRMRDAIARYTSEVEEARSRLDNAVQSVSGVSRALTTTTGGVPALQREVVRTAAAITGHGSAAVLLVREGDRLVARASQPAGAEVEDLSAWERFPTVLKGRIVRQTKVDSGSLLAVPMFYQDEVVGVLAVIADRAGLALAPDEEEVLVVLANNAAIAMENARLYEQEKETVQRLRQLDAMKTDFLSTVQHELRTPLTAILGLSDLIDMCWDRWEDQPKLEAVRDIQLAARNLYDIVETLIDFNAVEGESVTLHPEDVTLQDTVSRVIELVGERYKGGLPIPIDVDVSPEVIVYADPDRLTQVLRAVIDNAVKFSDGQGRVAVRASDSSRGGFVQIEVADEGIGIPAEDVSRVFDRFYQVDNSATRRYGGTGMGLALVKRLANSHGASVEVESELGAGTRVILDWPSHAKAMESSASGVNGAGPDLAVDAHELVVPTGAGG